MIIFACSLIGNDFIHNPPSINIRYGIRDLLLQHMTQMSKNIPGYFYLINDPITNLDNFKQFIKLLFDVEKTLNLEKYCLIEHKQHVLNL